MDEIKREDQQFIERRIVTGLIISTEYVDRIRKVWNSKLLQSRIAKLIASWCIDFYDQYNQAPGREIESIFLRESKKLKTDEVEDIEDILSDLSDDYERQDKFNVAYLLDQTVQYFDERNLRAFISSIGDDLDEGDIVSAKKNALSYNSSMDVDDNDIELSEPRILDIVEKAFTVISQPVVKYPRQLGKFLNDELVRGGFVAFMGPEKRGKTFLLMDIAMRAARQGANVAFFQAGDMTQEQQLRRICIKLAKKSDREKHSGEMYEPVRDCIYNQLDDCSRKERECDFGVFEGKDRDFLRKEVSYKNLVQAFNDNSDYTPCHNCPKYWNNSWGAVWLKKINTGSPLTVKEAKSVMEDFFVKNKRRFKLSSHPARTLTVSNASSILDLWERKDNFVADLIVFDYVDIMQAEIKADFRHQENDKWMRLRGVSQERHALVITATQTDADSYHRDTLSWDNFSEDKRRFGHVTAMYGLNQDHRGREKEIGILRLNEIVIRDDAFLGTHQVYVLQNLRIGQPCIASYF